jgi:transcriptional regulator with XRE-family HTH domain
LRQKSQIVSDQGDRSVLLNAERLTTLIKKRFRSQAAFADACGVSRQFVHQVITGEANPSLDTLMRFAEALGVQPGELLKAAPVNKEDATP